RGEHHRAQQRQPSITDRPANDTPRVPTRADFKGEDLGGVEPWDGEPGGTEGHCEEEDHCDGAAAEGLCAGRIIAGIDGVDRDAGETAGEEETDALDDGTPVESPAAADAIEGEDAHES
ncbi:MAG: hypothetical protein Q9207_008211, partial [Kuettlingeria erythrocarpa]